MPAPWPASELERLKHANRLRSLAPPKGVDFTSNDYLGLSRHPALIEAAVRAIEDEGMVGAGGSRLLRGHHHAHAQLEEFAAAFFGAEKTLYFGSGFAANCALFGTLPESGDVIVYDGLIHASVRDGMRTARAERIKVQHNAVDAFSDAIARARSAGARRVFVAVESLYSMDGDFAPLKELDALVRKTGAILVVDEAHATGVYGARGRGLCEGLNEQAIVLHTCGKALGAAGALVCASSDVIGLLINKARPFIYSTAPPPHLAATVLRALQLVDEEPWRRERVLANAAFARRALNAALGSQIVPMILGEDARALRVAGALQEGGFDVRAIRPPTVPEGTARLRLSINAVHSEDDIARLAAALRAAMTSA